MDISKVIERAKGILLAPQTEWPTIAAEATSSRDILVGYVLVLAAIPALAGLINSTLFGIALPFIGTIRVGIGSALSSAILGYVLSVVAVLVMAAIVNALAPTFGATKDSLQALKVVAYSYTASWVAGIGALLPMLSVLLALAGAGYSIYLLYLGLPRTMKCPPEKAGAYTAASVVAALVLGWIISMVVGGTLGAGSMMRGALPGGGASSDVHVDPSSPLGRMEQWGKRMEAAGKNVEAAQKSGDTKAQSEAIGQVLGAALGGGAAKVEALPLERIKSFLPDSLAGLPRKSISAERNGAMGMQVSKGEATYAADSGPELNVEITDLGGAQGLLMFAAWASIESEKQTDTGYEKTYRSSGRIIHEEWNTAEQRGEYSVVLGDRFVVKVSGNASDVEQLRKASGALDLAGLEALKGLGVEAQ
jgi:hypothetical protein